MRCSTRLLGFGGLALLAGCGGGGGGTTPPPTVTFTAAKSVVNPNESTTLTWSSTKADSCTAGGAWSGAVGTSGTHQTGALTAAATYSLTCSGAGGSSGPTTITVNVVPTATLSAAPTSVSKGGSATLTWKSTNATACTGAGAWTGSLATSGSQSTGSLSSTATYSLSCAGPGGASPSATATVTVSTQPIVTFKVYPTVVASGGSSQITWSSTLATSCTAAGSWSGSVATTGSQSTGPLNANATYSLTCTGPGGTSAALTGSVAISNTTMSLTPARVAMTLGRTQQFTATVPGGGLALWTVDGVAGGNASVGTVSTNGLYTAGTAAGAHSVVATSLANNTQSVTSTAAVTDLSGVYTYHNDLARDGVNTHEYALTPTTVSSGNFGKLTSCAVDGAIYAQPLWVANLTVSGVKHNVVLVATQHDGLFAFDADSVPCAQLWSVSLIDAAHGGTSGETPVAGTLVGRGVGDIQPEIGVTGTPVIDPTKSVLYVVSKSVNAAQTVFYQRLHAIDLATGSEKTGSPVLITGTYPGTGDGGTTVTFNPGPLNQRPGLALVNGVVYVAWAAHEDAGTYYGWVIGYQYTGSAFSQYASFNATPNAQQGGIWMSGGAPAADAANNLYLVTGNGGFDANSATAPNNDYGDSLLQLSPQLHVLQWFAPSDELTDDQKDHDFGAGGAAVLADLPAGNTVTHALICGGKDQSLYVLNRDLLGGFGDQAAVQQINFGAPIFATAAYWNNHLYMSGIDAVLQSYQLNTTTVQFTKTSSSAHSYPFPGTTPSISASGAQSNGIVWSIDSGQYCTAQSGGCGPAVLVAQDATNLATELWNSSSKAADAAGFAVKFTVPTVANGHIYVGTRGNNKGGATNSTSTPGELDIYGLQP